VIAKAPYYCSGWWIHWIQLDGSSLDGEFRAGHLTGIHQHKQQGRKTAAVALVCVWYIFGMFRCAIIIII
jgi:hypothetical protein